MISHIERLIEILNELKQNDSELLKCIYNFNLLITSLNELNKMIELYELKESIVSQIKFLIVNSDNSTDSHNLDDHMLHTVIYGAPGLGKTEVSIILAKIWTAIGLFKKTKDELPIENIEQSSSESISSEEFSLNRAYNNLPIVPSKKEKKLETKISKLISTEKIKNGVIDRLQKHIAGFKLNLNKLKPIINNNNYKLRKIKKVTTNKDYSSRLSNNLIDECIEANDKLLFNIGIDANTCIPDEKIRFITTVLQSPLKAEEVNIFKPIKLSIPKKFKRKKILKSPIEQILIGDETPILKTNDVIKIVSREDFVGGYLGQTAIKTGKLLQESIGKVLFIDEAYSLVNDEKDSYGREALTVLNRFMSEHCHEIVVIFAGYKDLLEKTIFHFQPGLKRRCSWIFEIKGYTDEGLSEIFKKQLRDRGWSISKDIDLKTFFGNNLKEFPAYGGDTLRLALYCKICYSQVLFDKDYPNNKIINENILEKALEYLKEYRIKDNDDNIPHPSMYF